MGRKGKHSGPNYAQYRYSFGENIVHAKSDKNFLAEGWFAGRNWKNKSTW
jgi:hypothetical protein